MAQGILVLTCAADGKRHRKSQGHQSPADPEINQPSTQQRNSVIKESSRNKRWGTIKQRFWEEWMGVYMARKLYDKMKTRLIWNARKSNCYIIYILSKSVISSVFIFIIKLGQHNEKMIILLVKAYSMPGTMLKALPQALSCLILRTLFYI